MCRTGLIEAGGNNSEDLEAGGNVSVVTFHPGNKHVPADLNAILSGRLSLTPDSASVRQHHVAEMLIVRRTDAKFESFTLNFHVHAEVLDSYFHLMEPFKKISLNCCAGSRTPSAPRDVPRVNSETAFCALGLSRSDLLSLAV